MLFKLFSMKFVVELLYKIVYLRNDLLFENDIVGNFGKIFAHYSEDI